MSTARNSPCPCGSGRKYKLCCLEKDQQSNPLFLGGRLMEVRDSALALVMAYTFDNYPEEVVQEAFLDFLTEEAEDEDVENVAPPFWIPFYLLHWTSPDSEAELPLPPPATPEPLALELVRKHPDRLTDIQRRYLEAAAETPYSFHETIETVPGTGIRFREIFTETETFVVDVSGSRSLDRGDILYGQVVQVDGTAIIGAFSPIKIPAGRKLHLIDVRADLRKLFGRPPTPADLLEMNYQIRTLYWNIHNSLVYPVRPTLQNTDGDPLEPHTLHYEIDDIETVFRKLATLNTTETRREILDHAERDGTGGITRIEFAWDKEGNRQHKHWENTVLGHLVLTRGRMTITVNSRKRAGRIRKRIATLAGDLARYLSSEINPIESFLAKGPRPTPSPTDDPNKLPEVQAMLRQHRRRHMEAWVDEKVPALGNITPRQAMRDKDGREKVAALLDDFERMDSRGKGDQVDPELYEDIRRELGLET